MQNTIRFPHVRRVDSRPAPNPKVQGCHLVRMVSEPADSASKCALVGTIGLLGMPTARALPAGVPGVYEHQPDPGPLGFVGQFLSQVVERPTVQRGALRPSNPDPLTNALEVFQSNRPIRALGLLHDALADNMVGIQSEAPFFAGKPFQAALRRLGSLPLQFPPEPPMSGSNRVEVATRVGFPVTVGELHRNRIAETLQLLKEVSGYSRLMAAWGSTSLTKTKFGQGLTPQTPIR